MTPRRSQYISYRMWEPCNHVLDGAEVTIPDNIPQELLISILEAIQSIDLEKNLPEQQPLDEDVPLPEGQQQVLEHTINTGKRLSRLLRMSELHSQLLSRIQIYRA